MGLFGSLFSSKSSNRTSTTTNLDDERTFQETGEGAKSSSVRGSNNQITFESTDTEALQFAGQALDRILSSQRETQSKAFETLGQAQNFAANITEKVSTTSDERLQSFGQLAFLGIAGIAALLAWRGL